MDTKADAIIEAVDKLALDTVRYLSDYWGDPATAQFIPVTAVQKDIAI
jgi:hypothetical protein